MDCARARMLAVVRVSKRRVVIEQRDPSAGCVSGLHDGCEQEGKRRLCIASFGHVYRLIEHKE